MPEFIPSDDLTTTNFAYTYIVFKQQLFDVCVEVKKKNEKLFFYIPKKEKRKKKKLKAYVKDEMKKKSF